jgi:hypothetical protein
MSTEVRRKRSQPAETDLTTVTKTDEGYRVRFPFDPSTSYLVTINRGFLECSCPNFQSKKSDPTYSCRHIAAVIEYDNQRTEADSVGDESDDFPSEYVDDGIDESVYEQEARERDEAQAASESEPYHPPANHVRESIVVIPNARMFIKRSLSPDGRIDSVSVELDFPVDPEQPDEIRAKAASALQLQTEIIQEFLDVEPPPARQASQTGNGKAMRAVLPDKVPLQQSAILKDIGSADSKWGKRFFINVEVAGKILKLFGTEKQLSAQIAEAGYAVPISQITEGKVLNIPCLVTTKPSADGRYLNVEQVFEEERPKRVS